MSGGQWDYNHSRIREELELVANEGEVVSRFPRLAATLKSLAGILHDTIHDLDYDLSSDEAIPDDAAFELEFLRQIGTLPRAAEEA